jgi:heavy metal sensor kinase
MSLASRLSLFFLVALALVLGGFSLTLFGLARHHLLGQFDERGEANLATLTAVVESDSHGLEWDTKGRTLILGNADGTPLEWGVFDETGALVAGSESGKELFYLTFMPAQAPTPTKDVIWRKSEWRIYRRTLTATTLDARAVAQASPRGDDGELNRYQTLTVTVASPLGPTMRTLRVLGLTLAAISLSLWCSAALAGRWLCRRALAPLNRMASAANAISPADLTARLPSTGTHDELDDLRSAFNDLLARMQESFARQARFTSEASHQLRTPLTAMLGQVEVALRRDRPPDEYRRALVSFQSQAWQLSQIVEALLFLARADAEARLPDLERFDLAAWLTQHSQTWQEHPRFIDLRTEIEAAEPIVVAAAPALLGQAIDNLWDNAGKYSPAGSPITLRIARNGQEIQVTVEDHGAGMTAEDLNHVFDPFFRSADVRRLGIPGFGLGLAVTKRIITSLGGQIVAQSTPRKGSRLIITLPGAKSA